MIDETIVQAHRMLLNENQIMILEYIAKNGPTIMERVYPVLNIPKPTAAYSVNRLDAQGLIEEVPLGKGRTKVRKLTKLGEAVAKLYMGKTISYDERLQTTAIALAREFGIKDLTKEENKTIIEKLTKIIENGLKNGDLECNEIV